MILLSTQGRDAATIAEVTFTSMGRVRDVIRNFNDDGFASLCPKYAGGRPRTFTLPERREIEALRARAAVQRLEPGRAGRLPGGRGGGRRHLPRGPGAPRGAV